MPLHLPPACPVDLRGFGAFATANAIRAESGLVAVTIMGIALASQHRVPVTHVLEFNETLRILFISGLFVLLAARVDLDTLRSIEWRNLAFLAVLVLVVRPACVLVSTVGSDLSREERLFLAATAPRGIVAAAVAKLFLFDLAALDGSGFWAVVLPFDGEPLCARFDHVRPARPWRGRPWVGVDPASWTSSLDRAAFESGVRAIRAAIDAVNQEFSQVSQRMYEQSGSTGSTPEPGPAGAGAPHEPSVGEDVIEGEFEAEDK